MVESTDGCPLQAPVIVHVHPSYPRDVVTVRRITGGRQAVLSDWNAYGVFAIGVQVKNANGEWTRLEFDPSQLDGLPKRFLTR